MQAKKEQAKRLVEDGKKLLTKWFYLKGDKFEDAGEMFKKAANIFKMIKEYRLAAETYIALVKADKDSGYDRANDYLNAGNMYKKVPDSDDKAIDCFIRSTSEFLEAGKFQRAGKCEETIGDIYETQGKFKSAIEHFQFGSTYFDNENMTSHKLDCDKKIAHLYALLEDYDKSIEEFEKVADYMARDKSLKWNAKDFYFKAVLCHLCRAGTSLDEEIENVEENFEKYIDNDVHFQGSDLSEFAQALIKAIREEDVKGFSLACKKNHERIDDWMTQICLRIKKNFEKGLENNN